jgi:hypothetical protein
MEKYEFSPLKIGSASLCNALLHLVSMYSLQQLPLAHNALLHLVSMYSLQQLPLAHNALLHLVSMSRPFFITSDFVLKVAPE